MLNYIKHFESWFKIKPQLDGLISYPKFQEGDVWWCHLGENVGHEECGKGSKFLRPIIVLKNLITEYFLVFLQVLNLKIPHFIDLLWSREFASQLLCLK